MSKERFENWSPGMKEGLKEAQKSQKQRQYEIDEKARNKKEGGFNEFIKDYSGGGGSGGCGGGGGGCGGGY